MRGHPLAVLGSTVALGAAVLLPASPPSAGAESGGRSVSTFQRGNAFFAVLRTPDSVGSAAPSASGSSRSFKHFSSSVTVGSKTYTYVMAGPDPFKPLKKAAANIKAALVPVVVEFGNSYAWDPTVVDSCDSGASALIRTENSPIFVSQSWTWGGTSLGTGQVTDAFQRANFWKYTNPSGLNPGFAVDFRLSVLPKVMVKVPNADAAVAASSCGNGAVGAVSLKWLDDYLQKTLLPSVSSNGGVSPAVLPIFLLHNVVEYQGSTSDCCVLGFHGVTGSSPVQTYVVATYDNSEDFSGSADISNLSHEVADWMDDPFSGDSTPPWGHVGPVTDCRTDLEAGDPLGGTNYTDTVNGFSYHPQEIAFFSWFYDQSPSIGLNGWYSDQGTFTSPAQACS